MMRASENPFAVQRIHSLQFRFEGAETLESVQRRFWEQVDRGHRRQVLLGHHGTGKSTLLRELADLWTAMELDVVWLKGADLPQKFVPRRRGRGEKDARRSVVLIDCAERLSVWGWLRIRWRFGRSPILQTAHAADRLPVLYECRSNFLLLDQLCRELLGERWAGFEATCSVSVRREVFAEQGGDIRQCFFELFDRLAQGTGPFGQSTRIMEPPEPRII
jgi:energy-coupling factor transporter ATP-binding protein EcfA2